MGRAGQPRIAVTGSAFRRACGRVLQGKHAGKGGAVADGRRRLAGRYRLDGSLGRGGMSEVFHGYDERLDRRGGDQAAPPAVGIGPGRAGQPRGRRDPRCAGARPQAVPARDPHHRPAGAPWHAGHLRHRRGDRPRRQHAAVARHAAAAWLNPGSRARPGGLHRRAAEPGLGGGHRGTDRGRARRCPPRRHRPPRHQAGQRDARRTAA